MSNNKFNYYGKFDNLFNFKNSKSVLGTNGMKRSSVAMSSTPTMIQYNPISMKEDLNKLYFLAPNQKEVW